MQALSRASGADAGASTGRADTGLYPATDLGTGKPRNKEEEWLSQIIIRLNDLFVTDGLTDQDLINYAYTIRDKIGENERVMNQIANNSAEQALLGDFPGALDEAVMESSEAHQSQMMQYLNSKELQAGFQRVVFDMLLAKRAAAAEGGERASKIIGLLAEGCRFESCRTCQFHSENRPLSPSLA